MSGSLFTMLALISGFVIVAVASRQIGHLLARLKLPLISGFLFTGIVAGPYVLNLIPAPAVGYLKIVDELALAFIAFSAGAELIVRQLRPRFKSIRYNTYLQIPVIFILGGAAFFYLCQWIDFARSLPVSQRIAISMMAGAILVARSPSSAMAVVNELRAKGPFTKTILGVTMIMDVIVIALFSICAAVAATLLAGRSFDLRFLLVLIVELTLSAVVGYVVGRWLAIILAWRLHRGVKIVTVLATGYGVFLLSGTLRQLSHAHFSFDVLMEPMLICMAAGFVVSNFSPYRTELMKVLHDVGPVVYVAFFTLTGASLSLDVFFKFWIIALALFAMRLVAIFIGAFSGGQIAEDPLKYNTIAWMGYVTQAGVGLGLAKEVAGEFPQWGAAFATIMIAVIVLNQLVGPPLFKWALYLAKEVRPRLAAHEIGGVRDAVIFGLDGESLALARLLQSNGWEVKIATNQVRYAQHSAANAEVEIHPISEVSFESFNRLGVGQADAIVVMLSDEENFRICELAYASFSTQHLIVRLNQSNHAKRFHQLGALVVEPSTAVVNLLDQFVRSPSAATLLLGLEKDREVIEFELRNPDLQGFAVRDLMLPLDIHIISIRRHGEQIVCGGFTQLQFGDWLTVVGSKSSLEQVMLQFGENRERAVMDMVGRAAPKEMASKGLEKEVREIACGHEGDLCKVRYNSAMRDSTVLELDEPMDVDPFFRRVAEALALSIRLPAETLHQLLLEREKESSTALRPDLAIPHIIIEGTGIFHILLVRCKSGINFSELAPSVTAAFVLVGTRDQREHHLYALSRIAKAVQQPQFQERWSRARNQWTLRNIAQA